MTRFLSLLALALFIALGAPASDAQTPVRISTVDLDRIEPTINFDRIRRPAPAAIGSWDSTYGTLTIIQREDGKFIGSYSDYGRINGRMSGDTFVGNFYHPEDSGACTDERQGSTNWGRFEFTFSDDGQSFTGRWSWCGRDLDRTWNGTKM